jgi:predicted membrane channel-forming protein YqfA (hemolysin III family)
MTTSEIDRSRTLSLMALAASWAAALVIAASITALWYLLADRSVGAFLLLAVPLAVIALAGVLRQHSRVHAERQFRTALDVYAEQQIRWEQRRTLRR